MEWGVGGEPVFIEKKSKQAQRKLPESALESVAKHINICHL